MDVARWLLAFITWIWTFGLSLRDLKLRLLLLKEILVSSVRSLIDWVFPSKRFRLNRIPKHLAAVFSDKNFSPELISDLVWYSVIYGIEEITLYDPWDIGKSYGDGIIRCLEKRLEIANNKGGLSVCVKINGELKIAYGEKENRLKVSLNVLGDGDGRGSLVKTATGLCSKVKSGALKPELITADMINGEMERLFVKEPDFLLKFGKTDCLFGYPPWALRITEILPVEMASGGRMKEVHFVECLEVYSRRNQRFGK